MHQTRGPQNKKRKSSKLWNFSQGNDAHFIWVNLMKMSLPACQVYKCYCMLVQFVLVTPLNLASVSSPLVLNQWLFYSQLFWAKKLLSASCCYVTFINYKAALQLYISTSKVHLLQTSCLQWLSGTLHMTQQ